MMMAAAQLFDDLPPWLDRDAWEAFIEMRKEKGKRAPFTDRARSMLLKKLATFHAQGIDVTAALEASVIAGWSDVFPPKPSQMRPGAPAGPSPYAAAKQAQGSAWMGRHAPRAADDGTIDMEP